MSKLSRRSFIHAAGLGLIGLSLPARATAGIRQSPVAIGRVTVGAVNVYRAASFESERLIQHQRDDLLPILAEIISPNGPQHNPLWYRIFEGFIHSGYVQRVPTLPLNEPLSTVPASGMLMQVTVPFTRTFYAPRGQGFQPLYRIYYESIHWVHSVVAGPDGSAWYQIDDAKNDSVYFVPATDLRPLDAVLYQPLAQDVAPDQKRIRVSVAEQTLTAYEGDRIVLETSISSGLPSPAGLSPDEIPTDTPVGYFNITLKMPSRHMGDGHLTNQVDAYELPGVPWTMAFHETGAALHGAYWHNHFGRKMSHGCVNMRNDEALWLFRWTDPPYTGGDWYVRGLGTLVHVA